MVILIGILIWSCLLTGLVDPAYHSGKSVFGWRNPKITPPAIVLLVAAIWGTLGAMVPQLSGVRVQGYGVYAVLRETIDGLGTLEIHLSHLWIGFGIGALLGGLYLAVRRDFLSGPKPPASRRDLAWITGICTLWAAAGDYSALGQFDETFHGVYRVLVGGAVTLFWCWSGVFSVNILGRRWFRTALETRMLKLHRAVPDGWIHSSPAQCVYETIACALALFSAYVTTKTVFSLLPPGSDFAVLQADLVFMLPWYAVIIAVVCVLVYVIAGLLITVAGAWIGQLLFTGDVTMKSLAENMLLPFVKRLRGAQTLCDHCLRVTVPAQSPYVNGRRHCEHCGQTVLRSSPTCEAVITCGDATLPFDAGRIVLANPDFEQLTQATSITAMDITAIYIDTRTATEYMLDRLLTYISNHPPVHGSQQVTIIHHGPLDACGPHIHNALRNTFARFRQEDWGNHAAPEADSPAYEERGARYLRERCYIEAYRDYTVALMLAPGRWQPYLARAQALVGIGQPGQAGNDARRALELSPDNVEALYALGEAHHAAGRHQEAIQTFTDVLAQQPDDANAYRQRGLAYAAIGEETPAMADFTRALSVGGNDPDAYWLRPRV